MIDPIAAPHAVFQDLNPGLAGHPDTRAGQAIKTAVSPDGSTLLVLTSGYNNVKYSSGPKLGSLEPAASNEYVFVYDIAGANQGRPLLKQVFRIPNTFEGLVFSPDGAKFYVSGGVDDQAYIYGKMASGWALRATIPMGHKPVPNTPDHGGIGFLQPPSVAGLAVSASGDILVAANIYNESISIIDTRTGLVSTEYDLRPYHTTPATGNGVAGGETPFTVAIKGDSTVYVSSIRDREVVVLDIAGGAPKLVTRIPMQGNPNSMVFDNLASPTKLYVAQDNSDDVAVVDLASNRVVEQIDAIAPPGVTRTPQRFTGAASNDVAVSPDGSTLFVANGGQNAVAIVKLTGTAPHLVAGLLPTGWYPQSVSVGRDGKFLYVVNGKSAAGPNAAHLTGSTAELHDVKYPDGNDGAAKTAAASNRYVLQIEKAGLLTLPVPGASDLAALTRKVATNNRYGIAEAQSVQQTMAALREKIAHVIYIVKENRTFDQVLGDLANGANADPKLTVFGKRVTPNFHAIATGFVTLDNFYDPGEVSGNGWQWSTAARESDFNTKLIPLEYAKSPVPGAQHGNRGAPYDAEGQNSDVDVGLPTTALRTTAQPAYPAVTGLFPGGTANFKPGINDDAAPDGPDGDRQTGYLWDSAVRAGLTVRNYGYFIDLGATYALDPTPFADKAIQAFSINPTLLSRTDPYFRSFDNKYPDLYRFDEWQREFNQFVTGKNLPALSFVRFMHDHMGNFGTAIGGIDFPEAQQADNDLAVGKLLDAVAHSPYAGNTLVFVVEDDAQDGPDHVDAHRSTAYIAGPYVKQKSVVSTRYTTVNMLRTIEDVLGIGHLNLNDAYALPMADVFDLKQQHWTYEAVVSPFLRGTVDAPPGTKFADSQPIKPAQSASWWEEQTKGFDWSREDRVPADMFNRIVWKGFEGNTPYPDIRR